MWNHSHLSSGAGPVHSASEARRPPVCFNIVVLLTVEACSVVPITARVIHSLPGGQLDRFQVSVSVNRAT